MNLIVKHSLDISSNMEELAVGIKKDIQTKYDLIVTEDSLPETKKLMAEINKRKADFKSKYKEFKEEVLSPLVTLDAKAKEIEGYFDDARSALDNQVKNFEKGKLEAIRVIIEKYRDYACLKANIDISSITINDLVMLSAVNTNSNGYSIAKKISDTIEQRIQFVENQILKAKLEAEEKAKYEREIAEKAKLEAEEKARQREMEMLARMEREKQEALLKAEREKEEAIKKALYEQNMKTAEYEKEEENNEEKEPTEDGNYVFVANVTFDITAPKNTTIEKITEKVKTVFEEMGISTIRKIYIK